MIFVIHGTINIVLLLYFYSVQRNNCITYKDMMQFQIKRHHFHNSSRRNALIAVGCALAVTEIASGGVTQMVADVAALNVRICVGAKGGRSGVANGSRSGSINDGYW